MRMRSEPLRVGDRSPADANPPADGGRIANRRPHANLVGSLHAGRIRVDALRNGPRGGGPVVASALFRGMDPSGTNATGRTAGLMHFEVDPAYRRRGYAVFLLSEAFRQFQRQGIMTVETQTPETNLPAVNLYRKDEIRTSRRRRHLSQRGIIPEKSGGIFRKSVDAGIELGYSYLPGNEIAVETMLTAEIQNENAERLLQVGIRLYGQ